MLLVTANPTCVGHCLGGLDQSEAFVDCIGDKWRLSLL